MIRFVRPFVLVKKEGESYKPSIVAFGSQPWFVKEKRINQYKTVTKVICKRAHLYVNLWLFELSFDWTYKV